jgi:hypothetical protein
MKNLDTIDVKLNLWEHDGRPYEGIDLIINGEVIPGTFDVMYFAVPRIKKVQVYLLTCSCGVAGCAGIWSGVIIKRRAKTVEWRDTDKSFPKKFYAFDQYYYTAAQDKALVLMRKIAEIREARPLSKNEDDLDYYYDGILGFRTVEDFEDRVLSVDAWLKRNPIDNSY